MLIHRYILLHPPTLAYDILLYNIVFNSQTNLEGSTNRNLENSVNDVNGLSKWQRIQYFFATFNTSCTKFQKSIQTHPFNQYLFGNLNPQSNLISLKLKRTHAQQKQWVMKCMAKYTFALITTQPSIICLCSSSASGEKSAFNY